MRAAVGFAVILLAAACSSDATTEDLGPDVEVIDFDTWRGELVHTGGKVLPGSPCSLPSPGVQEWADGNLACSTCYAFVCDGELRSHVCTQQCRPGLDDDPIIPRY